MCRSEPGASVVAGTTPRVDLSDLQSEHGYRRYRAYAQAKSANLLFALELHRRLTAAGAGTRSLAAQPGWTRTGLGPGDSAGRGERLAITVTSRLFAHSPDVGAQPILTAALADLPGGTYVTRARLNHLKGAPETIDADRITADPAHLAGLWTESERLTGVSYAVDPTTAACRSVPGTTGGRSRSEQ